MADPEAWLRAGDSPPEPSPPAPEPRETPLHRPPNNLFPRWDGVRCVSIFDLQLWELVDMLERGSQLQRTIAAMEIGDRGGSEAIAALEASLEREDSYEVADVVDEALDKLKAKVDRT